MTAGLSEWIIEDMFLLLTFILMYLWLPKSVLVKTAGGKDETKVFSYFLLILLLSASPTTSQFSSNSDVLLLRPPAIFAELIHSADPQSRPEVITIFTHVVSALFKIEQNDFQVRIVVATGGIVCLAEGIIDETCLVCFYCSTFASLSPLFASIIALPRNELRNLHE